MWWTTVETVLLCDLDELARTSGHIPASSKERVISRDSCESENVRADVPSQPCCQLEGASNNLALALPWLGSPCLG